MRFRKTLSFLILATALVSPVSAWAQQKSVAPTFRSACADVAASLPRHGGVKPPLGCADLKVSATAAASDRAKPFTQEQVVSMVRDGFGDESGAKLIEQRGIDFAPSQDFIQTLKAAGASEAFLDALRAAKPPEPASAKKPLNQVQVFALLAGGVSSHRVSILVQERGIDFEPTDDYLQEVRLAGGEDELVGALKVAKVTTPANVDPAAQARQAEIRQHAARGAEYLSKKQYQEAETEYRKAVRLDPENSDLHVSLARALNDENKLDEGLLEAGEALRLNPENDAAHYSLGFALLKKGEWDGAVTEGREALRLNSKNDKAHVIVGLALLKKEDSDGAIAEEREALRLDRSNANAHVALSAALGSKGDWGGAIAEDREALRLDPNNDAAHYALGVGLEQTRNRLEALGEYRTAYELKPQNPDYRKAYERLLQQRSK
jgi:tetratricopeptide (TPR) repeat protein